MPAPARPTSDPPLTDARRRNRRLMVAIAVFDAVLLLFAPIQWWLASGNAAVAIGYFVLAGLLVVGSVVVIHRLDAAGEDER